MLEDAFSVDPGPFADVPERITTDYLLYGLQQQMVQLTGQADAKGSIVITASAIVVSVSVTQFSDAALRWSLVTLVAFVLLAMLSSVIAVFPKFKIHPTPATSCRRGSTRSSSGTTPRSARPATSSSWPTSSAAGPPPTA